MEARNKLEAEAGLVECKTILGWLVDKRSLQLSLPNNKLVAWTAITMEVIKEDGQWQKKWRASLDVWDILEWPSTLSTIS